MPWESYGAWSDSGGASLALLAPPISYYGLFIAVILYVYPRFLLPLVLVFSVFGGKLLADLWTRSWRLRWVVRPSIVVLLLYSMVYGGSVDWFLRQDPRYAAERWLGAHVPPTAVVETYGPSQYLPRFPDDVRGRPLNLEGYVEEAFRARAPDYVVLTYAYYKRITDDEGDDFDQEEFLGRLWNGELGYDKVADFKTKGPVASDDLIAGLNSRVLIFRRRS